MQPEFGAPQPLQCHPPAPQVLYGRSGYLLGCLLLNKHVGAGSVPSPAMQAVVNAIIESGGWQCGGRWECMLARRGDFTAGLCVPGAGAGLRQRPAHKRALPPPAGRSLAGRLREPATFPTPLFYTWPPGPDGSPYLGAAHGLIGEPLPADCPPTGCSRAVLLPRRPPFGARQRQPAVLLLA